MGTLLGKPPNWAVNKTPGCLGYVIRGWNPTQIYREYFINHEIRIPSLNNQDSMFQAVYPIICKVLYIQTVVGPRRCKNWSWCVSVVFLPYFQSIIHLSLIFPVVDIDRNERQHLSVERSEGTYVGSLGTRNDPTTWRRKNSFQKISAMKLTFICHIFHLSRGEEAKGGGWHVAQMDSILWWKF